MKKLILHTILLSAALIFSTCKKYPDGSKHWKAGKKISGGFWAPDKYWKITMFTVNGADSLKHYRNYPPNLNSFYDSYDLQIEAIGSVPTTKHFDMRSKFFRYGSYLTKRKSVLIIKPYFTEDLAYFHSDGTSFEKNIFMPFVKEDQTYAWSIKKLTRQEFIITLENQNSYEIRMNATKGD
jgi:hypothetical protein